jgi:hypothetical protein
MFFRKEVYYEGGILSSRHSSIFIAPAVKGLSLEVQNGIFKHEFIHAWHWNNTPRGKSHLQNQYSERATSSFSIAYSKTFNLPSYYSASARAELLLHGGAYYPPNYSWKNFNKIIPTWLK